MNVQLNNKLAAAFLHIKESADRNAGLNRARLIALLDHPDVAEWLSWRVKNGDLGPWKIPVSK